MNIHAHDLKKEFVRKSGQSNIFTAVAPCSLGFEAGKLTVIHGRSGGGKSTLLNMLAGLLSPSAGKVFYDDLDIYGMTDKDLSAFRNEKIGFIPQGRSAIASLTVEENILLPLTLFGRSDPDRAGELMERFSISSISTAMPAQLSGGELRRMAVARSLICDPLVLFADEPTGDLDDENTQAVLEALRQEADKGKTVILVTHEESAFSYADRILKMNAGVLTDEL